MNIVINPATGLIDLIGMTADEFAGFLKLDQTTAQSVINGAPIFTKGITINNNEDIFLDGGA